MEISTASINVMLFENGSADKPKITAHYRRQQSFEMLRDVEKFQRFTLINISDLFQEIRKKEQDCCFKDIVVGFSAPFYIARTADLTKRFGSYHQISKNDVGTLLKTGEQQIMEEFAGNDLSVFEATVLKNMLNGYHVEDVINRYAEMLSIKVRYAALHSSFFEEIKKMVSIFGCSPNIQLFTFPALYARLLRDVVTKRGLQVFIDFGGETTEITLLKNAIIYQIFTVPFGIVEVLKGIMEKFSVDHQNAVMLTNSYMKRILEEEKLQQVDQMIKNILQRWAVSISDILEGISRAPNDTFSIFLLGDAAAMPGLKEALKTTPALKNIQHSVNIQHVSPMAFQEYAQSAVLLSDPGDLGLVGLVLVSSKQADKELHIAAR